MNHPYRNSLLALAAAASLAILAQPAGAEEVPPSTPSAVGSQPGVADLAARQQVATAFDDFVRAYETGDIARLRASLDPAMVGYQRLIDGITRDLNAQKQVRLHLVDTQVLAGPDVAVIQTGWEKRFFALPGMQAGLYSGKAMILLHRRPAGWQLAAISGDNPFASQSGVLAQMSFGPALVVVPPAAGFAPLQIEVLDPDIAGLGQMRVELLTAAGDREQVTLTENIPGRYSLTSPYPASAGAVPVPGNSHIEIPAGGTTLTLRYLDQNPGSNRPPSYLTRSIRIQ